MSKPKFVLTDEMREEIVRMLKCGKVGCDIAYELGCSQTTVSRVRKELKKRWDIWHKDPGGMFSN